MPSRRVALLGLGAMTFVLAVAAEVVVVVNDGGGNRLDLAVVGDSFAEQSHDAIVEMADDRGMEVSVDGFGGTALCAWMGRLQELRPAPPRSLVLSFAGNIFQPCVNPTCDPALGLSSCQDMDTEVVSETYRADLDRVLDLFEGTETEISVVLPPPISDPRFEARAEAMREMYRAASEEHPEIQVVDSATQLDPDSGGFQPTLPCTEIDACTGNENTIAVRQEDGIHLTPAGGRRYAQAIFDALDL
jgi:hypothetical protein